MKFFLMILLILVSFPILANPNEVECEGTYEGMDLRLEIKERDSRYGDAHIKISGKETLHYRVASFYSPEAKGIQYYGQRLVMEVIHWPHESPRRKRTYKGVLLTPDLGSQYIRNLRCRFPGA